MPVCHSLLKSHPKDQNPNLHLQPPLSHPQSSSSISHPHPHRHRRCNLIAIRQVPTPKSSSIQLSFSSSSPSTKSRPLSHLHPHSHRVAGSESEARRFADATRKLAVLFLILILIASPLRKLAVLFLILIYMANAITSDVNLTSVEGAPNTHDETQYPQSTPVGEAYGIQGQGQGQESTTEPDISLRVAIGSSTQISMFVIPFCVVVGWIMGKQMDFNFQLIETAAIFITVLVVAITLQDGTTNYMKGLMLIL